MQVYPSKQQVCTALLAAVSTDVVAEAIRALCSTPDNNTLNYPGVHAMPIEQAVSIYRIRAELNRVNSDEIEGLDELVEGLESIGDAEVHLAVFSDTWGREYCVFIGSETLKLAGVVKFPLRSGAAGVSPEQNAWPA